MGIFDFFKKKRTLLFLSFTFVSLITVVAQTTDIYVTGYLNNKKGNRVATVWKNGEKLYQLTDGERSALTSSIYVAGNDVYVAGTEDNIAGVSEGRVWKNGEMLYSFTHATQSVSAYSVVVSGKDVYVAGNWHIVGTTNRTGKVWKNGTELYSFDGSVSGMCILNNDIYVGGESGGEAKVWKNGTVCWTTNTTNFSPSVQHICESNGEIYVSFNLTSNTTVYIAKIIYGGYSFNTVWTHSYSSGYSSARVNSFAISGSDVYAAVNSTMTNYTPQIHVYKNDIVVYSKANRKGKMYLFDTNVYLALKNSYDYSLKVYKNETELYVLNEGGSLFDDIGDIFVVNHGSTSINNIQKSNISFYPNPVKDKLFIQTEAEIDKIEIYDVLGKKVFTQNVNDKTEININHLPKGIYSVSVLSGGKTIGNCKMVKQ